MPEYNDIFKGLYHRADAACRPASKAASAAGNAVTRVHLRQQSGTFGLDEGRNVGALVTVN